MKKLLFLFFLFAAINNCRAECAMSVTSYYPVNRNNISTNSFFIIHGYGMSISTINSFKDRKIFLESKNGELIELKLKEILTGKGENQAVFFPISKLSPNTKYHLKYTNETESETRELSNWNTTTQRREKITWTTGSETKSPLKEDTTFRFIKSESKSYGCGNSSNAIFETNEANVSEIIFRTELLNVTTNKISTFYIFANQKMLQVGYGMCSGGFDLKDNSNYKVRFTATDSTGKAAKTSDWKAFKSAKQPLF